MSIVNLAGQWLVNAHPWEWLKSAETTIDTVADQPWVALPTDLRSVIDVQPTDGRTRYFTMTTPTQLVILRTEGTSSNLHTWGTVVYAPPADGAPAARLDLWPTPTETATAVYTIRYTRDWKPVTTDQDLVDIPAYMEPLLVFATREYARGLEEEDGGVPAYARLDALKASSVWRECAQRDGGISSELGTLQGGAGSVTSPGWDQRFEWPQVPHPS